MKKIRHEEHVNAEAWAVPYADLLTLLLAFFVVMYSLSQINQSKYRVLAEALNQAFNGTGKVIEPVSPAQPARQVPLPDKERAANATPISLIPVPVPPQNLPVPGHEGAASEPSPGSSTQTGSPQPQAGKQPAAASSQAGPDLSVADDAANAKPGDAEDANLKAMSAAIAKALQPWVESKQVIIRQTKQWLEIEIRTDVLFPSGVAKLTTPAQKVLDGVAGVLSHFPNPVRIEGYTDNRPIDTFKFPSNWELSAARAGSVARLFGGQGVNPDRIGIFGWGEYHPVASNATPEGRNKNRRIAIVVLSDHGMPRHFYHNGGGVIANASVPPKAVTPTATATAATTTTAKQAAAKPAPAIAARPHGPW